MKWITSHFQTSEYGRKFHIEENWDSEIKSLPKSVIRSTDRVEHFWLLKCDHQILIDQLEYSLWRNETLVARLFPLRIYSLKMDVRKNHLWKVYYLERRDLAKALWEITSCWVAVVEGLLDRALEEDAAWHGAPVGKKAWRVGRLSHIVAGLEGQTIL